MLVNYADLLNKCAKPRQCLDRRIGDEESLKREVKKLEEERNAASAKIQWRFTNEDARRKLQRLYPSTSD
jgi:hypothetical protein